MSEARAEPAGVFTVEVTADAERWVGTATEAWAVFRPDAGTKVSRPDLDARWFREILNVPCQNIPRSAIDAVLLPCEACSGMRVLLCETCAGSGNSPVTPTTCPVCLTSHLCSGACRTCGGARLVACGCVTGAAVPCRVGPDEVVFDLCLITAAVSRVPRTDSVGVAVVPSKLGTVLVIRAAEAIAVVNEYRVEPSRKHPHLKFTEEVSNNVER